jgi:Membrane protein TerC, possibly involved in tellurium resistance
MELILPDFADPGIWISLITLCFLEIVLGIDNIIFISIVAGKLPPEQQRKARNMGLLLAMVFRVALLLCINWLMGLTEAVVTIPKLSTLIPEPLGLSWKDLILIAGGMFLIVKSTLEINHKLRDKGHTETKQKKSTKSFGNIILQIVLVDAVFSFDSILTAVGLVESVVVMIIAVIVSIAVMMLFAGPVSRIINKHPTLQMLALSFLIVIGVVLVAGGLHQEVSKSIIYSCLGFSLFVEFLNIKLRSNSEIKLNDTEVEP